MILFLYVSNVTVTSQPKSLDKLPLDSSNRSNPLFNTFPILITGKTASPVTRDEKVCGTNRLEDCFLYISAEILNFPLKNIPSNPILVTTSCCQVVELSPICVL